MERNRTEGCSSSNSSATVADAPCAKDVSSTCPVGTTIPGQHRTHTNSISKSSTSLWPTKLSPTPLDERPRYVRMRTSRPPPSSIQLNHHSFLVPAEDWPDSSDTEKEVPTGQPHRPRTITRVNRLRTIHKSEGMSKQLAQEFANLILILGEEERRKPLGRKGGRYTIRDIRIIRLFQMVMA